MNLDFLLSDEDFEGELTNVIFPFITPLKTDITITTKKGNSLRAALFRAPLEYTVHASNNEHIDDIHANHELLSNDAENSHRVILISHGYTEYLERYYETIYYFLRSGYSVAIVEHLGHGYSTRMLDNPSKIHVDTFDTYVEDFHTFYEDIYARLGSDYHYYLYGHSMGGCIASLYIEKYPNDFLACVLSSPMHEPASGGVPKFLCRFAAATLELIGKGTGYLGSQDQDYKPTETFEEAAGTSRTRWNAYNEMRKADNHYHTSTGTVHWMHEAIKASAMSIKNAGLIKIPVLLTQAGHDTYVVASAHDRFVANCRDASIIRFPDAKHEVFNSDIATRATFFGSVIDFFNKH